MPNSFFWMLTIWLITSCALEEGETAQSLSVDLNSGEAPEGVSVQDVDLVKDGVIDINDLSALAYFHGQKVPENSGDMVAGHGSLLDILIVAKVPYQKSKLTGNYNRRHRAKNKQHADAVVKFLRALPAKVADHDYQIALMRDTCIHPVITRSSQPDPAEALEETFWQLDSDSEGPGRDLPGGALVCNLLDNVITGLTDIHTTSVSFRQMPTAGIETRGDTFSYESLGDRVIERINDKLFMQYRRLANGLVVLDYFDGNNSTTCGRTWLRENSKLVVVAIDIQPSQYKGFRLCAHSQICTMPDIETTLRSIGRLSGNGASLQKNYLLYGITDKGGDLYNNPYSGRSQRATVEEISSVLLSKEELKPPNRWAEGYKYTEFQKIVNVRVDWDDFENYQISDSDQNLVDYLGDVNSKSDREQILDDIASFAAQD